MNGFLIDIYKRAESFILNLSLSINSPRLLLKRYAFITVITKTVDEIVQIREVTPLDGMTMTFDWGDGTIEQLTGVGSWINHTYSEPGEYKIKMKNPERVKVFDIQVGNNDIIINSKDLISCVNIKKLSIFYADFGIFNSVDFRHIRPDYFVIDTPHSTYEVNFNSSDISSWSPQQFGLQNIPNDENKNIIFNSVDVASWSPDIFVLSESFQATERVIFGEFNSVDISNWSPSDFRIVSLKGHFNSSDISSWNPIIFQLEKMRDGTTGTFDTGDISSFSLLEYFELENNLGINIIVSADSFSSIYNISGIRMANNYLSRTQIDQILSDVWDAYPLRTQTGGIIQLNGNNSSPGGIFQAANPPDTGREYAYELLNDSEAINSGYEWNTIELNAYNLELLSEIDGLTLGVLDTQTLVEIEVIE